MAQKRVYGNLILEDMLDSDMIEKLRGIFGGVMYQDCNFSFEKYFGQVILPRYITATERQEVLAMLSEKYPCHLYTHKKLRLCLIRSIGDGGQQEGILLYFSKFENKFKYYITIHKNRNSIARF